MADPALQTSLDTVRLERLLDAPVDRVWSFLIDSDKRALWFAAGPMELEAGGKLSFTFAHETLSAKPADSPSRFAPASGRVADGHVEAIDPPHSLAFHWGGGDDVAHFTLTPEGDRTRLVITHKHLTTRTNRVMVASGWDAHTQVLARALAGERLDSFWGAFETAFSQYDAAFPAEPETVDG